MKNNFFLVQKPTLYVCKFALNFFWPNNFYYETNYAFLCSFVLRCHCFCKHKFRPKPFWNNHLFQNTAQRFWFSSIESDFWYVGFKNKTAYQRRNLHLFWKQKRNPCYFSKNQNDRSRGHYDDWCERFAEQFVPPHDGFREQKDFQNDFDSEVEAPPKSSSDGHIR